MMIAADHALLRTPAVLALTGVSKTTLYDRIKNGLFTRPIRLGPKLSAWRATEVSQINAALAAGRSDAEIRGLVGKLERSRQEVAEAEGSTLAA